jgi:hypothetical protein
VRQGYELRHLANKYGMLDELSHFLLEAVSEGTRSHAGDTVWVLALHVHLQQDSSKLGCLGKVLHIYTFAILSIRLLKVHLRAT